MWPMQLVVNALLLQFILERFAEADLSLSKSQMQISWQDIRK